MSDTTPLFPNFRSPKQTSKVFVPDNNLANVGAQPHQGLMLADTYRLEKLLGQGAMGQVWQSTHLVLNEPRAIKFLAASMAGDSTNRQRFIFAEAKNALRLQHPNIVRLYDIGQEQGLLYIIMEYIVGSPSGFDFKEILAKNGKISLFEVDFYLKQIAAALWAAHSLNLVHRDIKPANILLTADNVVKLSDFGIVKDLTEPAELTNPGYTVGTPVYIAPEQVQGRSGPASDQYALGVVLYEWLTGEPPFSGSVSELLAQHIMAKPPALCEIDPALPRAVSRVVAKALAKQPEDRFSSVLELADAFHAAIADTQQATHSVATIQLAAPPVTSPELFLLPPNNLPETSTRFIGRQMEITQLADLVLQGHNRLVTLVGVGGTGKTRLALQVAEHLLPNFKDGVFFVALENSSEQPTLISELATTLRLKDRPDRTLLEVLKSWLAGHELLLVLDNFEQLVVKGAVVVAELLKAAPRLKILVTSRENLGLSIEQQYPVTPMNVPIKKAAECETGLESLLACEAVALFVERAKAVRNTFELTNENSHAVAEICRKLDGLPLALELAAARVTILPPHKILERLNLKLLGSANRDLPARQQTLRGAIEWSYNLLEPAEQVLFARLSIFAGGCTLEAAEAVCNANNDLELEPLEGVELLLHKSLLRQWDGADGERHYGMLTTLREYALEKLGERTEYKEQFQCYVNYYFKLIQDLAPGLRKADALPHSLHIIESEYENIREILYQLLEMQNLDFPQIGLELANQMWFFWKLRGYLSEAQRWLDLALSKGQANGLSETFHFAKVLEARGYLARLQNDFSRARSLNQQALAIHRKMDNRLEIASSTSNLATVFNEAGELDLASELSEQSLAMYYEVGNDEGIAIVLNNLAILWNRRGDYRRSLQLFQESLELGRKVGDPIKIVVRLSNIAAVSEQLGDYIYAEQCLKEAQALNEKLDYSEGVAMIASGLASLAILRQDYSAARSYNEKSLAIYRELGNLKATVEILQELGFIETETPNNAKAFDFYRQACQVNQQLGNLPLEQIKLLEGLGHLTARHADLSNLVKAVKLYAVAQALRDKLGSVPNPESVGDKRNQETLAYLRQKLSVQEFDRAWQSGLALEPAAALQLGLNEGVGK